MFCPKCGKEIPNDSQVCPECDAMITQREWKYSTDPAEAAPEAQAAPAPAAAPAQPTVREGRPLPRFQYFMKEAAQKFKIMNFIALGIGILCLILVIVSANKFINGSVFEIPIIAMLEEEIFGDDLDEIKEEYDEMMDVLQDAIEDEDEIDKFEREFGITVDEIEDELNMSLKKFAKLIDPISLNSIVKIGKAIDDFEDEAIAAIRILINVITVMAVIFFLLTALAVLFSKTWISVLTYILSIGFFLFTGGIVLWLIASVAYITMAVLFSKLKFEYRVYLRTYGI